jgi:hypothetical protein
MRKLLILITFLVSVVVLQAQHAKEATAPKSHKKEIAASKLPKKVTNFITLNLPHAKITKVIKQRSVPAEKYLVYIQIKSRHHMLVFDKKGEYVRVVRGKK